MALYSWIYLILCLYGASSYYQRNYGPATDLNRIWSPWTPWSECSRSCGGGIRMRTRTCKLRYFMNKNLSSKVCLGNTTEYETCRNQKCLKDVEDFWKYQCSLQDDRTIGGRKFGKWLPHISGNLPCELQCISEDGILLRRFGKAMDGTPCHSKTDTHVSGTCVNGRCTSVDCFGKLDSDYRFDVCGVCGGNNSTCIHHRNTYWERPRPPRIESTANPDTLFDYNRIFEIPARSTYVSIREYTENNFLAIMEKSGKLLVNGNWKIESPGRFKTTDGLEFIYSRSSNGRESLFTAGPTSQNYLILALGKGDLPTVDYEYWMPKEKHKFRPRHFRPSRTGLEVTVFSNSTLPRATLSTIDDSPNPNMKGYNSYYHQNSILKPESASSKDKVKSSEAVITSKSVLKRIHPSSREVEFDEKHKYRWEKGPKERRKTYETAPKPNVNEIRNITPQSLTRRTENILQLSKYKNSQTEIYLKGRKQRISKKNKREKNQEKDCHKPCEKPKKAKAHFCKSDFVLRATVVAAETHGRDNRYEVEVIQSFKNSIPILSKEYIWTTDLCRCPRLRVDVEYVLMGRLVSENRETRLVLARDSFARRYTRRRARTVLKLVRDSASICKT